MKNWWNFLNDADMQWTSGVRLTMMILPFVGLFLIFLLRRPMSRIPKRVQRIIFGTLGGMILTFELTQDITKIVNNIVAEGWTPGAAVKHQVLEMLELCRLNTILLGLFLVFNKISWIKWIAGTTLFGGFSTVYDHWGHGGPNAHAAIWGVLKHSLVLTIVPAAAIASHSEKFTMKNLGLAHIFNYVYVAIIILINYLVPTSGGADRSIANLNEADLATNALVGWAPDGTRIVLYVLFVTVIFWIWWAVENFIHRHTNYERKNNYLVLLAPKQLSTTLTNAGVATVEWVQTKYGNSKSWIIKWSTGMTMKQTWNKFAEWTKIKASAFGKWAVKTTKEFPQRALGVIKGTPSWIARNSAILFTIFLSALFLTLVGLGIHAAVNGWYDGTTTPWQGMDPAKPSDTLDPTWAKLPGGYVATFVLAIIGGALSIWALGGWLRGSAWINKSNTYVKGTVYVRTKAQNAVFRIIAIMIALTMLTSFFLTLFYEDVNKMIAVSGKSSLVNNPNFSSSSVFQAGLDYALTPSHWYYQCFLSSLFMGFALTFKKYKWVQYLLPLAFIGAVRTFIDISDWADDASWTNVGFLRMTYVHIMIVMGPIFIMVSNRYRYSLKDMKVAAIYTFLMAFIAYMIFTIHYMACSTNGNATGVAQGFYDKGYGELTGVKDILHISDTWFKAHPHLFFWFVVCPFGLLVFLLFTFAYNFFYFKSQAKGNFFKRWITMWKPWYKEVVGMQWKELKASFSFFNRTDKPVKVKKAIFGIAPSNGRISEDPYVTTK